MHNKYEVLQFWFNELVGDQNPCFIWILQDGNTCSNNSLTIDGISSGTFKQCYKSPKAHWWEDIDQNNKDEDTHMNNWLNNVNSSA